MSSTAAATTESNPLQQWLSEATTLLRRPTYFIKTYDKTNLRPDLVAGVTVAVVMLPQAIAYALIAELPPQTGLYAAIIASIVGALWGSSSHLNTGPTNAASLLVLSTLTTMAAPGSPEYIMLAGLMAVVVGLIRLLMGLAHLGVLVNFVSDSVVIGFTTGAGILISVNQVRHILRLDLPGSPTFYDALINLGLQVQESHGPSIFIAMLTMGVILLVKRWNRKWPSALLGMIAASIIVAMFDLGHKGVVVLHELPRTLPPFTAVDLFNFNTINAMSTGILAIAAIGLVEAMSIARTIATQSGEYVDSNQEFVGQGLANIAAGFFSGYTCSGSFTRSAINYDNGAKTGLSSVFSGLSVLLAMLLLAPLAVYIPRSALAGVLLVTAYSMVDRAEMKRIWHTSKGDGLIMVATLLATLFLPLQLAVLTGVVVSFIRYVAKTSAPEVHSMVPDARFEHFAFQPDSPECPQLGVLTIEGSLYFGAAHHVEDQIRQHMEMHPKQRFLLLRMHRVNHCDVSGLHMLEAILRLYRQHGGDVFMVGVRHDVWQKMKLGEFVRFLGIDHFLSQERAVEHIFYKILDPAVCIYKCPVKIWRECQTLPKSLCQEEVPLGTLVPATAVIPHITPQKLWSSLNNGALPPQIIDVREPGEFAGGHIPGAELIPMPKLMSRSIILPQDKPIVLVCRTGRRTTQIVYTLQQEGYNNLQNMIGGMVAWEEAGLPAIIA